MELFLNGIGIVSDSSIKLDGLTVIAGNNNSGKTTVGKALYAVVDATSNIEEKHEKDTLMYLIKQLNKIRDSFMLLRYVYPDLNEEDIDVLPPLIQLYLRRHLKMRSLDEVKEFFFRVREDIEDGMEGSSHQGFTAKFLEQLAEDDSRSFRRGLEDWHKRWMRECQRSLKIWNDAEKTINQDPTLENYTNLSIERLLNLEFNRQIQPALPTVRETMRESMIRLSEKDEIFFDIRIAENSIVPSISTYVKSPFARAFLIDDPYVVEDVPLRIVTEYYFGDSSEKFDYRQIVSHRDRLRAIMHTQMEPVNIIEASALTQSLQIVMEKIEDIIPGEFSYDANGVYYITGDCKLNVGNLATGAKVFSIIKKLLISGLLDETTILVLDEPESHLHPSWINKLAEIVVVLVKELNIHILLTTHSSNFLLAIDSYIRQYRVQSKCNIYQTNKVNDGKQIKYEDVTDKIDLVYADFAKSFSEMNALRKKNIMSEGE